MHTKNFVQSIVCCFFLLITFTNAYKIGVGMYDITPSCSGTGMSGYGYIYQRTRGIHLRLRSRAFIIEENGKYLVYVALELGMTSLVMKKEILSELQKRYGDIFNDENVLIAPTHTHSAPGGYTGYLIYDVCTPGFDREAFHVIVNGTVESIAIAYENMVPGTIRFNKGKLFGINMNRSPSAYLANPEAERKLYPDGDTNKDHLILRFDDIHGNALGVISWYSVHATSLDSSNLLISGDIFGYASLLFEQYMDPQSLPGKGKFVAAFMSLPSGDASPNTGGAFCPDGSRCDPFEFTCKSEEKCKAVGPGSSSMDSCVIIAEKLFQNAKKLFEEATQLIERKVDFRYRYLDMENIKVESKFGPYGKTGRTCRAALGASMMAGTIDGAGPFFKQGLNGSHFSLMRTILSWASQPTEQQIECQQPKPIVMNMGGEYFPFAPRVVPIQLLRIGQVIIVGMPTEVTTMAGRRIESHLKKLFHVMNPIIIVSSMSNCYASYTTTYEEYVYQRYEGASTLYGPFQLSAFIQEFDKLGRAMMNGEKVSAVPPLNGTHDIYDNLKVYQMMKNYMDSTPFLTSFGDVNIQPRDSYKRGEMVQVEFWAGSPHNDLRTEESYFTVERLEGSTWKVIATDSSLSTLVEWNRWTGGLPHGRMSFSWSTSYEEQAGTYRICHFGSAKTFFVFEPKKYSGCTKSFLLR